MKTAKEIISNYSPVAIIMDETSSVLVRDQYSKIQLWMDVSMVGGELTCDWNQYIFNIKNPNDILIKELQKNLNIFQLTATIAIDYYERFNVE